MSDLSKRHEYKAERPPGTLRLPPPEVAPPALPPPAGRGFETLDIMVDPSRSANFPRAPALPQPPLPANRVAAPLVYAYVQTRDGAQRLLVKFLNNFRVAGLFDAESATLLLNAFLKFSPDLNDGGVKKLLRELTAAVAVACRDDANRFDAVRFQNILPTFDACSSLSAVLDTLEPHAAAVDVKTFGDLLLRTCAGEHRKFATKLMRLVAEQKISEAQAIERFNRASKTQSAPDSNTGL